MTVSILAVVALLGAAGDGATYIRAGNVFDGERFIGSRVIVVEDGRIAAVEESGFVIPAGAETIDATDATVMPGLIDGHCHFMEPPKPYTDNLERYGRGRLEAEAMSAFASSRRHLLLNGVTTIADMGGSLSAYQGLRAALDKGRITGPELYFSGPQITAPGGHPAGTTYRGEHDLIDLATFQTNDTAAVRKKVAAMASEGVDFIAIVYDGEGEKGDSPSEQLTEFAAVQSPFSVRRVPRLKLEVARAAIAEAHRHALRVFARVGSQSEALDMVNAGADGIEQGFETVTESLFVAMAARGVYLTPAFWAGFRRTPSEGVHMQYAIRHASKAGVPLCIGTDFPESHETHCGDDVLAEMRIFEIVGVPRPVVITAATAVNARKLGRENELGRVAPGYRANLVFMRGSVDTGELSANRIERVMLHGQTVVQNGRVCADCESRFRENSLSYLGYPYWDPLLSWMAGGTATDYDFLRTGITAEADFMYSIRNMWFANTVLDLPSPIPRTALRAGMHFDDENRLFYGLGNDTRLDETTEYSNFIFREWASSRMRISGPWKALSYLVFDQTAVRPYPGTDIGATKTRNDTKLIGDDGQHTVTLPGAGQVLPDTLAGHNGGNEIALTLTLAHDTRDHQDNPWYGHYVGLGAQVAPKLLPNSHSFEKVIFDARGYVSAAHRHILAGRLLCQQAFGDVPFYYLPEFGGDTLGRGYMPFRFRDRASVIGQLEYRFPIWSLVSGVVFADFGQFQPSFSRMNLGGFHPSVGFGPSFSFGPNESQIVGVDVGFTPDGWNLVMHSGHVF
ncbi:MAG TPA: amidohydrolase family protein [bacterium]|nr:amidohydrolase family protein [bacterium]